MRRLFCYGILGILILLNTSIGVHAEDMRAITKQAIEKRRSLLETAKLEADKARKEAMESRKRISADKNALIAAIQKLKIQNATLQKENKNLGKKNDALADREEGVVLKLEDMGAMVQELAGFIRTTAKDLDTLLNQSHQTALAPDRGSVLDSILKELKFPGMDDIQAMVELLFDEIRRSGEVRTEQGRFVNRAGEETSGNILFLGNFTAAYQLSDETGF